MMNTPEPLNESRVDVLRTALAMPHGLTDHDPAAHHHAVEIDATIRVSGRELRARSCRLRSLSLGGALLEFERLPIGTLTNITFGLPSVDDRLSLDAVVHSCSREGVNVLFDSPRAWEVWALWRYLVSLDDEPELESTRTLTGNHPALEP